ncbi:MAG: hypothetical protein ABH883_03590 [Candidatus Omnitrophota bacterium]
MKRVTSHKNRRFTVAVLILAFFLAVAALSFLYFSFDKIVLFFINNYTEYRVSCGKWEGGMISRLDILDVTVESEKMKFSISAGKISIVPDMKLIKNKQLLLECVIDDVSILSRDKAGQDMNLSQNFMSVLMKTGNKFDRVSFFILFEKSIIKITDLKAFSRDIHISGDSVFRTDGREVELNLQISFSPALVATLDKNLRDNVLSLDAGGWYSTVINYKGNPLLLKAFYSLTLGGT